MNRKRRRELQQRSAVKIAGSTGQRAEHKWPGGRFRHMFGLGVAIVALWTAIIYGQTVPVPTIDYEDHFYLVHSPYLQGSPVSHVVAVWNEPYFANFHPATTTTWLLDRAFGDKSKVFDGLPFRISHLVYAVTGASLLILLFHRLGIPAVLAALGGVVYATHPIHTEVVAWLSARKDLVSLIFIVLSFLTWLRAVRASTPAEWRLRHALTVAMALLAVLSKPVAVILPALFVAHEFCAGPHAGITSWRWTKRRDNPLLNRVFALTAIFVFVGGTSAAIFYILLSRDSAGGGWLIFVPIGLLLLMFATAPSSAQLAAFHKGGDGVRVVGAPFGILSVVFGAGCAWTLWAQQQVGAIKGGLTLLPTLNLTFDAMLAYAGKVLVPASMSASYTWSEYPYVSLKGALGALLVSAALWVAMRLAGSPDRHRRLIAFGIFWYLIALIPVSNLVPTSTKMADRYLFVPSAGVVLALLALAAVLFPSSRPKQLAFCGVLALVIVVYGTWSYRRTEVWCGKTTLWNGRSQPDLSLWTAAVETDPSNTFALTSLGLEYLRLSPPQVEQALMYLNRALQIEETNQSKIAGDHQLILSPVYEGLGDGYITQASQLTAEAVGSPTWLRRKEAFVAADNYFGLASKSPSGFASSDARVLSRLAEACEGWAQMDAQEIASASPEARPSLIRERDELRSRSEESMLRAREVLSAGKVSRVDPNYRMVMLGWGNIIFGREVGATNGEKERFYHQALPRYQEASALLPGDPQPVLYQGLCYERLTAIAQSPEEKHRYFILAETALRKALALKSDSPEYSPALPYRALASLYAHVNDFHSVLDVLKKGTASRPRRDGIDTTVSRHPKRRTIPLAAGEEPLT